MNNRIGVKLIKLLAFALLINTFPGCTWFSSEMDEPTKSVNDSGNVVELKSAADFDALIKRDKVIVDFYATWCGPCVTMGKHIHEVAEQYPEVTFIKVNTDSFGDLSTKRGVSSIPTVVFFIKGEKVGETVIGLRNPEEIKELIKKNFGIDKK